MYDPLCWCGALLAFGLVLAISIYQAPHIDEDQYLKQVMWGFLAAMFWPLSLFLLVSLVFGVCVFCPPMWFIYQAYQWRNNQPLWPNWLNNLVYKKEPRMGTDPHG
jgi:hypothetical protein